MTRVQAIVEEMRHVVVRVRDYAILRPFADRLLTAHRADLEEALAPLPNDWTIGCVDDCRAVIASRRKRMVP